MATRRILVPFDFTGPSKRACDYAIELAAATGATLTIVHVLERFDIPLTPAEHAGLCAGANRDLERVAALVRPHVRELETLLAEGTPWDEIATTARDRGADLIVMGTHGRRGVARVLLGSVASRVVRTASVPVVTVPEPVAVSRNAAGAMLAVALEPLHLASPAIVALSRGALTVATMLATKTNATLDLWGVEPVVAPGGVVIGAVGEDGAVVLDEADASTAAARDTAVADARKRLGAELSAVKGARSMGDCWRQDVVLVADGLFSAAQARVAIEAMRKLRPRRVIVASPVAASVVLRRLEGVADAAVCLQRAVVADLCVYRDDVVPSDLVARELLLAPHPSSGDR